MTPPKKNAERQKPDGTGARNAAKTSNAGKPKGADRDLLSVVVFKDHLTPRTFHFPRFWVNQFGILLGLAGVITLASVATSIRYVYLLKNARHDYAREIEEERRAQELAKEAQENKTLQQKIEADKSQDKPLSTAENATPQFLGNLFSTFPANTVKVASDLSQSPITIEGVASQWKEKSLRVHFELHYTRDDGGNQKGRIHILARGPDTLLAYPSGSLEPVGSSGLVSNLRGEQFSVSRLRMVDAVFEGFSNRNQIRTLEVIITNLENELLIHQSLPLPAAPGASAAPHSPPTPTPTPTKSVAPKSVAPTPAVSASAPIESNSGAQP